MGPLISRCLLPDEDPSDDVVFNVTSEQQLGSLIYDENGEVDGCAYRLLNGTEIDCDRGYVYDRSTFGSSAVMDWNLVCDDSYWRATAQSVFMLGVLLGSYIFGDLSDRIGRKPAFVSSVIIQARWQSLGLELKYIQFCHIFFYRQSLVWQLVLYLSTGPSFLFDWWLA